MKRLLKEYSLYTLFSMVFWAFAVIAYAVFRFMGLDNRVDISIDPEYAEMFTLENQLIVHGLVGAGIGVFYAIIEFFIDEFVLKRTSILVAIILQAFLLFIAIVTVAEVGITLFLTSYDLPITLEEDWWYNDAGFNSFLIYIVIASFSFNLFVITANTFGENMFWKMLIGYYKFPKEEKRIFMFLDLKGSTTIAEKIGHVAFSKFIQDCFFDFSEICPKYKGAIYQYAGDEIIVSWKYEVGTKNLNCINCFFEFSNHLQKRANYYSEKYGLVPSFKAGLHGGTVTAVEIGSIKKELAYHGDVVNTTARIQGECNKYNVPILISGELLEAFPTTSNYGTIHKGNVLLRGKEQEVEVFTLNLVD